MQNPSGADWFQLRVSLQTLQRLITMVRQVNLELRTTLPTAVFDPETDEPLDLLGEIEAFTILIESEHIENLEAGVRKMVQRLEQHLSDLVAH